VEENRGIRVLTDSAVVPSPPPEDSGDAWERSREAAWARAAQAQTLRRAVL
jgi:hypothetical protein